MENLDEIVRRMKKYGEFLMPYSFPRVPYTEETDISVLRNNDVTIDGYELVLHYSKSDFPTYYVETFQILGKLMPFLPFYLVCKLGKKFLGEDNLSLVETFRDQRKIYCWTVHLDRENNSIPIPYEKTEGEDCIFEGFKYMYLNPKMVNFY